LSTERPWYRDRNFIVGLALVIVTVLGFSVAQIFPLNPSTTNTSTVVQVTYTTTSSLVTTVTAATTVTASTTLSASTSTLTSSLAYTVTVTTMLSATSNTSANPSLAIEIIAPDPNNQSAWFLAPDGKRYARIPRDHSVLFTFRLSNVGSSSLEIWGTGMETTYPNRTKAGPWLRYAPIELLPGQTTTVDFTYGTNMARFPGYVGGELSFIVYGANQEWANTETVLLGYD